MTATMKDIEKEKAEVLAEREELQKLIKKKKKVKAKVEKEEVKADVYPPEDMVDWVEGVFIFRDQPGQILSFIYLGTRVAMKDGEIATMPLEIADHINSLNKEELEWVREGRDQDVGEQGQKKVKSVTPRTEFRVTRSFKQHKSVKMKKPERHKI
ncbi:hypothetical protein OAF54_02120 [bacterium]|nr:hypothetical protein [bacterium]